MWEAGPDEGRIGWSLGDERGALGKASSCLFVCRSELCQDGLLAVVCVLVCAITRKVINISSQQRGPGKQHLRLPIAHQWSLETEID